MADQVIEALIAHGGRVSLRDGEEPGTAEVMLITEDGAHRVFILTPKQVRVWAAALATVAARV